MPLAHRWADTEWSRRDISSLSLSLLALSACWYFYQSLAMTPRPQIHVWSRCSYLGASSHAQQCYSTDKCNTHTSRNSACAPRYAMCDTVILDVLCMSHEAASGQLSAAVLAGNALSTLSHNGHRYSPAGWLFRLDTFALRTVLSLRLSLLLPLLFLVPRLALVGQHVE